MSSFFGKFPLTLYSFNRGKNVTDYEMITNILFRVALVRKFIQSAEFYVRYMIEDGETAWSLASKFYNDPDAYWIILYANEMEDPFHDWPMDEITFERYIIDKYGSIETAQITPHHYEKVVVRENRAINVETREMCYWINKSRETDDPLSVPQDTYDDLPVSQNNAISITGTETVHEKITKRVVSMYDYERDLNDAKRQIKIIKKEYYPQIMNDFRTEIEKVNRDRTRRRVR